MVTELPEADGDAERRYGRPRITGLLPSLAINAGAPLLIYQIMTAQGVSTLAALTAAALFPAFGTAFGWLKSRQLDVIGVVSLVFILAGIVSSLVSGDVWFLLAKESFVTATFGLVCLGSLLMPRPLMFYFGRQFSSRGDPRMAAGFDAGWQRAEFRFVIRMMTVVWGVTYLAEAGVRILLLSLLPIPVYLVVSQGLVLAVTIGLIAWTLSYARRASRRRAVEPEQNGGQDEGHCQQHVAVHRNHVR